MRYGREKAGLGPGVEADVSTDSDFDGVLVASPEEVFGGGGGSMEGAGEAGLERGSGNDGMSTSAEDVSMVICFVVGGDCLSV